MPHTYNARHDQSLYATNNSITCTHSSCPMLPRGGLRKIDHIIVLYSLSVMMLCVDTQLPMHAFAHPFSKCCLSMKWHLTDLLHNEIGNLKLFQNMCVLVISVWVLKCFKTGCYNLCCLCQKIIVPTLFNGK